MADLVNYGHGSSDRDIEQALIALKKGAQLLKYSRKGKPKFRSFRVSPDETSLKWLSHGEEKTLKLSSVSKIVPGQRTPVFKRYLRPEKDHLSFSLLYNNGERSLDLICKDKVEAEVWLTGLKALIKQGRSRRTDSDISDLQEGLRNIRQFSPEFTNNIASGKASIDFGGSDVGSEHGNMQLRSNVGDGRVSVSSNPSVSSGGSGQDDIESFGDVYVWGEVWSDGVTPDGFNSSVPTKIDVLTPKPLESNVVLDVLQIACGARHVALVTKQGEVFTWGEESGGRLGHGVDKDFSCPHLVEYLALTNVEFIAPGEYHTCVVSNSGDLFTWGDGTHNAGILGHASDVSHWIPRRVSGELSGLQVLSVACGAWHSALATSNGKLFTFGDGKFGVLGHGDRESVAYPKQVQMSSGLKTVKVACGVWHTAAIVEVTGQSGTSVTSRKLFTWGDGDKNQLGHGNKETYLVPTCVSSLIDYNFHQLGCGHTMTIALTSSGHIFTMGSTAHGQLGNPSSDGKIPCLVQEKLVGEFVEEISCGAYHVAVLTSRSEVFTWGRGANGRLGHGDIEDRKSPKLVESLKDKHVKNISCGSNFTSSICIHKWISGTDHSVCTGCRQAFSFTRKRHNCYHCGMVHCGNCSSKKALKAALAPTPGKPHRVCDACYAKLKAAEAGTTSIANRKVVGLRSTVDGRERSDHRSEARRSRLLVYPTTEPVKYFEIKSGKHGTKHDSPSLIRASQVPSLLQLKDIAFPSSLTAIQNVFKPGAPSPSSPRSQSPPPPPPAAPLSPINSRSNSPYSRRPSPPRSSTTPFSKNVIESLRKSNELLNKEVSKLQNQIKILKQKNDTQDLEIQKLRKAAEQSTSYVAKESSKSKEAMELVKSITDQLMELSAKLPPDVSECQTFKSLQTRAEAFLNRYEKTSTSEASSSLPASLESSPMEANMDAACESARNKSRLSEDSTSRAGSEKEITEVFEPGVYITYVYSSDGGKIFKRVRFSKRKFHEQQASEWWSKNKDRVFMRYAAEVTKPAPAVPSSTPPLVPQSSSDFPSPGPPPMPPSASDDPPPMPPSASDDPSLPPPSVPPDDPPPS